MTNPSPLYNDDPIMDLGDLSDEQRSALARMFMGMNEMGMALFWRQLLYHTTLMMFGFDVPRIGAAKCRLHPCACVMVIPFRADASALNM